MHVDEKMLDDVWIVLHNKQMRMIFKFIGKDGSYRYSDIKNHINSFSNQNTSTGRTAYYIRRMLNAGVIKLDEDTKTYILTRIGCRCLEVMIDFENICSKYDLSDCKADGMVVLKNIVVGRK